MTSNDMALFNGIISGYHISDKKTKAADSTVIYFGFINKDSSWYIMVQDNTNGTYRYIKGNSAYSTNWGLRETLTYDYFDTIFNA